MREEPSPTCNQCRRENNQPERTDPWWRVGSVTDSLGNQVCKSYSATSFESSFEFNSNNSIQNVTATLDVYGRQINVQKQQSPTATNYDTVSTSRNFSGVNPTVFTSNPCSAASGSSCSSYGPTNTYDMFGRLMTSVQSGSNATVTDLYAAGTAGYDAKSTLSPAPSGENTKATITEVDGLGRQTVNCAVSSSVSGNVSCGVGGFTANGMVEAATDTCTSGTLITDEWFAYDKDGHQLNLWQLTPHSTQYYQSTATFFGNGLPATVDLASPSLYTMTYGLDGEGRFNTLTDTTANQSIVTGTTYFPAANPEVVSLTSTDNNAYTYDLNTNKMTKFVFTVGSNNLTGTLTWNANGTLGQLAVTDGFNSGGSETCYSNSSGSLGYGYDDLGRLAEFDCGSGNWGQQFAYDQYDNLSKTILSGRTGTTWNPGYSATANHCTGCTYDSNGDVTGDGNDVYGWNEFSKLKWTATSGTPTCGTSGRCATYDAFGRMVETSNSSTWSTYWYTQAGGVVMMSGTTVSYAHWPTTHGIAETLGTTNFGYMPKDWIGNTRTISNISNHTVSADQAYTPYGEIYNIFGANNGQYQVFASTIADLAPSATTPIMWDTPNRELSYAGRWLSPDPAGFGWNQYAYATNPNSETDPTGLGAGACQGIPCGPPSSGAWGPNCFPNAYGGGCAPWSAGGPNANCYDLDGGGCAPGGVAFGSALNTLSGNMNVSVCAGACGGQWTFLQSWIGGRPNGSGTWNYYPDDPSADLSSASWPPVGEIRAANNGWSLFGWDKNAWKTFFKEAVQPWKDTCAQTFAKAFGEGGVVSAVSNNLEGGPGTSPDEVINQAGTIAAAQYVVNQGLVCPGCSSIYRGILSGTETAATGFVLLDAYTRIGQGLYVEGKSYLAGECH